MTETIRVKGYTRSDGTKVPPHERSKTTQGGITMQSSEKKQGVEVLGGAPRVRGDYRNPRGVKIIGR